MKLGYTATDVRFGRRYRHHCGELKAIGFEVVDKSHTKQ